MKEYTKEDIENIEAHGAVYWYSQARYWMDKYMDKDTREWDYAASEENESDPPF